MLEGRKKRYDRAAKQSTRAPSPVVNAANLENGSTFRSPNDDNIMTRKPIRIRRQRIPVLQSGYCAICNLPYNSIEDHVQSKKHQKLIGEDANYISLNGYIHSDVGIESLLSLTGIDAIGLDDFSPKPKRRNISKMPRTRASSVVSDVKPDPVVLESDTGHRLRSRKNINYMTPPLDDDSFQFKPESFQDTKPDVEPVRLEYKEYRELRSSTRALAKLTSMQDNSESDVWDSGRPKRACISRHKRCSADERLVSDNKTYYKVEVLSSKLRSSDRDRGNSRQKESKANESDKGLIVKFKKLRTSELVQLNNEATNFLFPKKDDSSEEDEEECDTDEGDNEDQSEEEEKESTSSENIEVSSSSEVEEVKPPDKFKVEDEASMDSTSSDCKTRRKRRSHAEAFIMDNQKYYKFETPGSSSYRLRYHGSYLSPVPSKSNGDLVSRAEPVKLEPKCAKEEESKEQQERLKVNLDEFTFSFETVPENEKWYQTFRRQDMSEERYHFTPNYHWNDFVLPHQIPHLRAIDPRTCYNAYKDLKECLCKALTDEPSSEQGSSESDVEICDLDEESSETPELDKRQAIEQTDEDSKLSEISSGSVATTEEIKEIISKARRRTKKKSQLSEVQSLSPSSGRGKNPRKSPRQHASTLAILSSLVHQRKRRSKNGTNEVPDATLQTIPEEQPSQAHPSQAHPSQAAVPVQEKLLVPRRVVEQNKPPTPRKERRKRVDYIAIAAKIDEELSKELDFDIDFEPTTQPDVNVFEGRLNVGDIMRMYDESKAKENEYSCRRFFNGAPGRKPGKRKKNLTGWPKVKKRKVVKEENDNINGDDAESGESDSVVEAKDGVVEADIDDRENECDQDRKNRVGKGSDNRDNILQPYVYVKKIDNFEEFGGVKKLIIRAPSKRTLRKPGQRRLISPGTTVSPRILRKPKAKGRWYRDR